VPEELDDVDDEDMPILAARAWQGWQHLHQARGSNGYGPMPISFTEVHAFAALSGIGLLPWEVELIRAFDGEYMRITAERSEKRRRQSEAGKRGMR